MRNFFVICLILALWPLMPAAGSQTVAIGEYAILKDLQHKTETSGVLVARDEFAPCSARSHSDDIHFDSKHYTILPNERPCFPGTGPIIPSAALAAFKRGAASLFDAATQQMVLPAASPRH